MQVRVQIDITKPLKTTMKLKKYGGKWFWINFLCSIIGQANCFYPKLSESLNVEEEKLYSTWLKATRRRPQTAIGQ